MIVTLSGVTGTGKSFFKNAISQELGFENLVIVTTRAKRKGEINGIDKEFVSEQEFNKLKNQNEIEFFPVFTSVEEIRKAFPKHNVGYVEGPGRWYFNLVRGKNVILNPFSENAKPFVPQEIEDMLNGNLFDVKKTAINKDQQIMIGKPKVYPEKLVNTLKSYFEGNKDVRTAFLVEYSNGEDRPHSLVIVDTEGDMESLVREASIAAKGSLEDGNYVEFMELDLSNTIGVHVINSETPFYKREN